VKHRALFIACLTLIAFCCSVTAEAKKKKNKRPPFNPDKSIRIVYGIEKWNSDSTKIEEGSIILKDVKTNSYVQIRLQETAPDSGTFGGNFNVNFGKAKDIEPEIYIPPRSVMDDKDGFLKVKELVRGKKLRRRPIIIRKSFDGQQVLDVFNSRKDADRALQAYKKQLVQKKEEEDAEKKEAKELAAKAVFEAQRLAKMAVEKKRQEEEALRREAERVRLQELEKKRAEERKRKQAALKKAEKERRKKLAVESANAALKLFKAGNFKEAEKKFEKAVELDPENTTHYYSYGVTLYRNNKFNKSLVIMRLATGTGFDATEKDYYIALSHFRLKENKDALKVFNKVRQTKHKTLGPSSAFYMGLIHFNDTKYEKAKPLFQEVLDTSQDPRLDEQAEAYIENIARILYYARNKANQFFVKAYAGIQHDSNVLTYSTDQVEQGSPSDYADIRYSGGASFQWRPIYEKKHEWSLKAKSDLIYSSKEDNVSVDPLLYTVSTQYIKKGTLWGKGHSMDIEPGYEMLYLDHEAKGTKESYLNSTFINFSNTLIMHDRWFSTLALKFRMESSPVDDNQNSTKIAIATNNVFFLDKKKKTGVMADLGYTSNAAKGDDFIYNRIDLGAKYLTKVFWDMQFIGGPAFYMLSYPNKTEAQNDTNINLTTILAKKLNDWLSGSFSAAYTINNSNIDDKTYNKYTIGIVFNADLAF
jgi:tetratricopeptide (TPR) repeat protein